MEKAKGFTIIELTVAVIIVAILAVVLSVNVVQYINKAKNAAIKGIMNQLSSTALIYYQKHQYNYGGFCGDSETKKIFDAISVPDMKKDKYCHHDDNDWAVCARLNFPNSSSAWCVDSEGIRKQINKTDCVSNIVSCS
ncbi:MAG: Uncharacterized protein CEN87_183 [Parcubacteria group bacterium Licking1014_1]|nr:MAG: Uncharacterized protein CEN87_183 [Parcubacteria group bacterium Licking1014_1]